MGSASVASALGAGRPWGRGRGRGRRRVAWASSPPSPSPSSGTKRLVVVGLGFVGERVARAAAAAGWEVRGTVEDEGARGRAVGEGWASEAWVVRLGPGGAAEGEVEAVCAAVRAATHVLSTVRPGVDGADPVLGHAALRGAVEEAAARGRAWVGYVSSTGVYGDRAGGWVDEDTAVAVAVAGGGEGAEGGARAQAEAAWRSRAGARVFRMGALYGPGRSALEAARRGEAAGLLPGGARGGPGEARRRRRFTARIHVDDAARVVATSMAGSDAPGRVYNVVDDDPTSRADVIAHARGLLGLADPDEASAAEQASAAGPSHVDEKRVRNARIKDELGVRLLYPSYVDGLRACLAAEDAAAAADAHTQPPTNGDDDDDDDDDAFPGETC